MISRELIKTEIDKVKEADLELLYKIVKAMVTPTEVLERYPDVRLGDQPEHDAAFLLSVAGMYDSGPNDSSENASAIVTNFVLKRQRGKPNDRLD